METLNAIIQGKNETFKDYIERFTHEWVEAYGSHDNLMCFIFKNKLHDDDKFKEELGLRAAIYTSDLLIYAQPYINYKEMKLLEEVMERKQTHKGKDNKQRDDDDDKENDKDYHSRFTDYKSLNTLRGRILQECLNIVKISFLNLAEFWW